MLPVSAVAGASQAEELVHRLYHDSDYRHWKQPGTSISCCSDQDCAPVKAELRQGQQDRLTAERMVRCGR